MLSERAVRGEILQRRSRQCVTTPQRAGNVTTRKDTRKKEQEVNNMSKTNNNANISTATGRPRPAVGGGNADSAAASVEAGASGTAQPVGWNCVKEAGIILSDSIIDALRTNSAKKCPVCGSLYGVEISSARTAHRFLGITEYFVRCNVCGHSTKGFPTPYDAIAAWNENGKTVDAE